MRLLYGANKAVVTRIRKMANTKIRFAVNGEDQTINGIPGTAHEYTTPSGDVLTFIIPPNGWYGTIDEARDASAMKGAAGPQAPLLAREVLKYIPEQSMSKAVKERFEDTLVAMRDEQEDGSTAGYGVGIRKGNSVTRIGDVFVEDDMIDFIDTVRKALYGGDGDKKYAREWFDEFKKNNPS